MRRRGSSPFGRTIMPVAAAAALALAGCGGSSGSGAQHSAAGSPRISHVAGHSSLTRTDPPASRTAPASPSDPPSSSAPPPAPPRGQLPRGGRAIIGHYRVIAYYGAAGAPALGVLGQSSPEQCAREVIRRADTWKGHGLPVQPAFELLATVAQGSPGKDGDYSAPVPHSTIERYLRVAHQHKMLLILDLQPGHASFLSQAESLHHLLLDPSVSLALDPEWKVPPGVPPGGGLIGSTTAAGVNAVSRYLSKLVERHHLPDKLMIVHEFTKTMLPDRQDVIRPPHVQVTFHADGFGSPEVKRHVFRGLAFPPHPWGVGFKLFLRQDSRLMTPDEVLRLRPRPDVVTYE